MNDVEQDDGQRQDQDQDGEAQAVEDLDLDAIEGAQVTGGIGALGLIISS